MVPGATIETEVSGAVAASRGTCIPPKFPPPHVPSSHHPPRVPDGCLVTASSSPASSSSARHRAAAAARLYIEEPKNARGEGVTLGVPNRTFVAVAIPGRLKNRSTAASLLGGCATVGSGPSTSGLSSSTRDDRHFLRTSLGDDLAKVLPSTPSRACGLLVRVRKKRSGAVCVTVLGRVTRYHHFDGLADFYFSPPAESREGRNVIELIRNDTQGPAPWEPFIPPPLFCRFSQPAQYRLDQALFSSSPASIPSHEASSVIPSARYPRLLSEAQGLHSSSGSQAVGPAHLDCTRAAGAGESTSFCETAHEKNESFHGVEIGGVQGSTEQKDDSVHTGEEEHLVEDRVKKAGEEFNAVARFSDARVPSQPPAAAFKACADDVLLNSLHQLLAEHAIWLRGSLDARLPEDFTAWRKKPAYAKTCFLFMDGPWRGCLCKIGYDPRQHPESRFSQTIDFRDPYFRNTSWRRISARQAGCSPLGGLTDSDPHSSAGSGLSSTFSSSAKAAQLEQQFLVPPSRPSVIYQFREIQDEAVQKLLRDAPMLPTPCKETGWFSAATMRTLRELLAMKSQRMRESRGEIPC